MKAYNLEESKEIYHALCQNEPTINIYSQGWYLDAVVGKKSDWKVVLVEEKGEIQAAFSFQYTKKHGLYYIENPWQSSRGGIWIRKNVFKSKRDELVFQRKVVNCIIDALPKFDVFKINFNSDFINWQPLYWNGFFEQTNYSMIIEPGVEDVLSNISSRRRNQIRNGLNKYRVKENSITLEQYWSMFEMSCHLRGMSPLYSRDAFFTLYKGLNEHNACIMRCAENIEGEVVAGSIIIYDKSRHYDQFSFYIPEKGNEANAILKYYAIEYANKLNCIFDFEGSMIPGVCEYNATFNPHWEPYHFIYKYSLRYQFLHAIKMVIKACKVEEKNINKKNG
ncbi:MAG: hypothetical protein ACLVMC_01245 [[Clostridium] symbiosum]